MPTPATPLGSKKQTLEQLTTASGAIIVELRTAIQETEDPKRLEELLSVNDQLVSMLTQIPSLVGNTSENGEGGLVGAGKRPKLVLQGLGLSFDGNGNKPLLKAEEEDSGTDISGLLDAGVNPTLVPDDTSITANVNGAVDGTQSNEEQEEQEEQTTPTTPRIDKGKGRAEPEEEEPEKVLSPSYVIDSEEEDEDGVGYGIPEEIAALMPSPTERYVHSPLPGCIETKGDLFLVAQI